MRARPHYAGLELTLACPCRCVTCGSGAGRRRARELDTHEWRAVIDELAALGCRRVTFLGGEPLSRPDWFELAQAVRARGMALELITSGMNVSDRVVEHLLRLSVGSVTVSVDGTREAHDEQRGVQGSFERALDAITRLDEAGLRVGVTTQVNARSLPTLEALAPELQGAGAIGWQLQLTMLSGLAGDAWVLPPERMPEVFATIRRLCRRAGLRPFLANNLGYMSEDDPILRSAPGVSPRCWLGCFAGVRTVGIASDGTVRGCLALPYELHEGNVLDEGLRAIWRDPARFSYTRAFEPASLTGACAKCEHGAVCRGGCNALAMRVHGRTGVSTHCVTSYEGSRAADRS